MPLDLIVNVKAATALRITVPTSFVALAERGDRIIF
jgi:hypothetical protein